MTAEFQQMEEEATGYILAGGQSRRMGRDKRLIRCNGMTLLERAITLLKAVSSTPPLLVGDNLAGIIPEKYQILSDAQPGCGPLGGLVAALAHCPTHWALVMGADMPLLSVTDLNMLFRSAQEDFDGLSLKADARIAPLPALYAAKSLPFWAERLRAGHLAIKEGISLLNWQEIQLPRNSCALFNINHPWHIRVCSELGREGQAAQNHLPPDQAED